MLNLGPYSTKEFPNIRVYPTIIDRILEGVAVLLAIAAWVCAIWVYILSLIHISEPTRH